VACMVSGVAAAFGHSLRWLAVFIAAFGGGSGSPSSTTPCRGSGFRPVACESPACCSGAATRSATGWSSPWTGAVARHSRLRRLAVGERGYGGGIHGPSPGGQCGRIDARAPPPPRRLPRDHPIAPSNSVGRSGRASVPVRMNLGRPLGRPQLTFPAPTSACRSPVRVRATAAANGSPPRGHFPV
jgi:hypothetical protein